MWTILIRLMGFVAIATIVGLVVVAWRVQVWLDRWADAMVACFPELLQLAQQEPLEDGTGLGLSRMEGKCDAALA
jgi:hypothetical protein